MFFFTVIVKVYASFVIIIHSIDFTSCCQPNVQYSTSSLFITLLYFILQNTILFVIVVNMYNNNFKKPFQTQCYSMWLQNARKQIKQLFEQTNL